jgi:DNA polymerase III subunit delta
LPSLSYDKLLRTLREPPAAGGAFFLHGEEEFLRERASAAIVAAFLDDATRDFNLDAIRGSDASADDLASVIATPPMMASHRVVVVRDAQGLSVKAREVVEAAAKNPIPGLVLVLTAAIPSGSKAKFYDELKKAAVSVEFAAVSADEAPDWLMEAAEAEHGLTMAVAAARGLVAGLGTDLGLLSSELRKLASYVDGRTTITPEDVRAVGGNVPRQDRWSWFDLVAERRWAEAVATLPILLEQGENAVGLVIGIGGQLLKVGLVCAGGPAALERELKSFERWKAKKLVPTARRWTLPEVDAAMGELLRTDRLLKSASLNDRQAMEELLLRLWGLDQRAAA